MKSAPVHSLILASSMPNPYIEVLFEACQSAFAVLNPYLTTCIVTETGTGKDATRNSCSEICIPTFSFVPAMSVNEDREDSLHV